MPLSDIACRAAKSAEKTRKLSDGGGLQLWVQPTGSKLWRLAYRFQGKPKTLSLGAYPTVSLSEARTGRESAKKVLAKGLDPVGERRNAKAAALAPETTFRAIADEWLSQQIRDGRADATLTRARWLLKLANQTLGEKQIKEIQPLEVLAVLRSLEERDCFDTAHRLRMTMSAIFELAIITGRATVDPAAPLKRALVKRKATNRAAILDSKGLGALLRAIYGFDGQLTTQSALKLMALLFPRPGELRAARWTEFDLDNALWSIPAERTKMRRAHAVPLSPQAIEIFRELRKTTGSAPFVFPSLRSPLRPMSENTLNAALRRLGYAKNEATAHGFRSSASTLLNESGHWHPDAIERQLAHVGKSEIRNAYARGQYWDERVRMMAWWADYLDKLRLRPSIAQLPASRNIGLSAA